jgi:hypothetical protein
MQGSTTKTNCTHGLNPKELLTRPNTARNRIRL